MCTRVIHQYGCGHQLIEKAHCANFRGGGCKGVNDKFLVHAEACDGCGG